MDAPTLTNEQTLVRNLPGMVIGSVTYESYNLSLVTEGCAKVSLLVRHGGGQESIYLRTPGRYLRDLIPTLPAQDAFMLLFTVREAFQAGKQQGINQTADEFKQAFIEGRLKKRKLRGQNRVKIWIETAMQQAS
jgi:hypothetical protein